MEEIVGVILMIYMYFKFIKYRYSYINIIRLFKVF